MKKPFIILSFILCLLSFETSLAYTSTDVSNAAFLADWGVIVKQASEKNYRLDDSISRAEVVGIALKMQRSTLPSNYFCQNYFTDVKYNATNNWVCRAMELAADVGMISRANAKARPQDSITRAEALAIFIKAAGLSEKINESEGVGFAFDTKSEWQLQLLRGIFGTGLLKTGDFENRIIHTSSSYITTVTQISFYPNRPATRAEVFGFVKTVGTEIGIFLGEGGCDNCGGFGDAFSAINVKDAKEIDAKEIFYFGEKFQFNAEGIMEWRYPFSITVEDRTSFRSGVLGSSDFFSGVGKWNNRTYYKFLSLGMCSTEYVIFPGVEHLIKAESACFSNYKEMNQWFKEIELVPTDNELKPRDEDVLFTYYDQLKNSLHLSAYNMRSPADVSLETFQSWYKNVTSVVFREDTLKDLGDNTYEFLVEMTENGIKSTYKVKSKVDVANFKINNLSSVKQ